MMGNNPALIKERIILFLKRNGPSLPVHIAKDAGMDILFTSAFLSELISNRIVKTSNMKVGTSPLYFLPGQESGLEKFSEYIKGKEGEALSLLKSRKFLEDLKQEPAIKIALRHLKDFANPFEKNGEIIWKYFTEDEREYKGEKKEEPKIEIEESPKEEPKKIKTRLKEKRKTLKKEGKTKNNSKKNDEKFFNKIKEHLIKNNFEILDIISFSKSDLILKVKKGKEEKLIIAYDKKRITEKDILMAYKKSGEMGLNYSILSKGDTPKKTNSLLEALKNLNSIEKVD